MSKQKIIQSALEALCLQFPKVKNWWTLPLYQIGVTMIESREKGLIYHPREIEEKVNKMLESQYYNEKQRSRSHYIENGISYENDKLMSYVDYYQ